MLVGLGAVNRLDYSSNNQFRIFVRKAVSGVERDPLPRIGGERQKLLLHMLRCCFELDSKPLIKIGHHAPLGALGQHNDRLVAESGEASGLLFARQHVQFLRVFAKDHFPSS